MCGIGFAIGLQVDKEHKLMLILGLAEGIDGRGGNSNGYCSVDSDGDLRFAKKSGPMTRSRLRFLEGAVGGVSLLHSRWATCGRKDSAEQAHPFAIRRGGRTVIFLCHNGMVPDAWESAKANGRKIEVDSEELAHLVADGNFKAVQNMSGYGVVAWIHTDHRDVINIARLSQTSDMVLVSIKGGGFVGASTKKILTEALKFADLEAEEEIILDEIGRIYQISAKGVFKTPQTGLHVQNWRKWEKGSKTADTGSPTDQLEKITQPLPAPSKPFKEESYTITNDYRGYHYGWN